MAKGELKQDMTVFEYSEDVQRYLDRITGKTASLFATAAQGGAMVAGVPAEQVEAIARQLERSGPDRHRLIRVPEAGHGFLCEARSDHHPTAAARTWRELLAFLEQSLTPSG